MKNILAFTFVVLATIMATIPSQAAIVLGVETGFVKMADGRLAEAALPQISYVEYVQFPSGNWGYTIVMGQCSGDDIVSAPVYPVRFLNKTSQLTVCSH